MALPLSIFAQVTTDVYRTTYSITWSPYWSATTLNHNIRHKTAKWYEFRDNLTQEQKDADTFNDEDGWTMSLDGNVLLQATNTSVDTIYVHKGSNVSLAFPYLQASQNDVSINHYNRWFDFRTDGNFYCNLNKDGETIADLLTPRSAFNGSAYRFANGYVQIGVNTRITYGALDRMEFYYPTDEEFLSISSETMTQPDNNYYVIACDVSGFNDTYYKYVYDGWVFGNGDYSGTDESQREFWEPTLEGRAVFYIIGVEDDEDDVPEAFRHYWDFLNNDEYHGGTNTGNEKYLEEYDIVYPSHRTSDHTNELVALSKAAEAYTVPNDEGSSSLNVRLEDGNAGIVLDSWYNTISGSQRIMQFYKDGSSVSPWKVDNNSTATILVTKTVGDITYNIARYRLTFKDSATPLTQTQVAGLTTYTEEEKEEYWWGNMGYRSPQYIADTYEGIASLTFSYDTSINGATTFQNGQSAYYPYPLDWDTSSYAFYDGCAVKGGSGDIEGFSGVAYSMYAITNGYIGETTSYYPPDTAKDSSGYWLYIDASDYPGVVAELEFEERLCIGSQLVGTAWVKSAGAYGSNVDDAAVLLTIMGVTDNDDGTETHTPIYRQCSSQIRRTTWLNGYSGATYDVGEDGLSSTVTGKGSGTNEWFQLYFSFVNSSDTDFDRYTLRVDNYCASTAGGDFYFDDVEVYVLHPTVSLTQVTTVCSTDSDMNPTRFDLGYESIMSRLGHDPDENGTFPTGEEEAIDFLMINETKYLNFINEHSADYSDITDLRVAAIEASVVTFWADAEDESEGTTTPTIHFYLNFEENELYDDSCDGTCNVISEDGAFFYHRIDEYGNMMLSLDCYTNMAAYTPYVIILEPSTTSEGTAKYREFAEVIGGTCTIESEYYISSTTLMRVNGEIVNPTETCCVGQTVNVTADVSYENADGETVVLSGVYFDWFFGDKETFTTVDDEYGVSLQEALLILRNAYPDAEELTEDMKDVIGEGCYGIIYEYLHEEREGGLNNTLILHQSHLSLRILSSGIEIVCQPIPIATGTEYVCFGYVPLTLSASGNAPLLNVGFHDVVYPNDEFVPNVRLGLPQIEKATQTTDNASPTSITINLRDATYVTAEDDDTIDHLGEIDNNSMDQLFLIDSDDPYYLSLGLQDSDFSQYSLPMGKIEKIYAREDNVSDDDSTNGPYMRVYFYETFTPREGYYYVFMVYFEEKTAEGTAVETPCQGSFPLEMKIVPEFLTWQGDETSNWNNDNYWRRADKDELRKPSSDTYPTNSENGTDNGLVPMLFSKVVIPEDSRVALSMAGDFTPYVIYDMMVYEDADNSLTTQRFRVNLCDQIHLSSGAQLLYPELLLVNKVWSEVSVPQDEWKLVAMPLNSVYAGDWYTKSAYGYETAEYFTDITFNDTDNNRYNPDVYQRSWDKAGTIVESSSDNRETPAYASTGWTSTYNDASTPHTVGEGFSLKTWWGEDSQTDSSVVFRFPKADESYTHTTNSLDRTGEGTLLISQLVDRLDPDKDGGDVYTGQDVSVILPQTSNGYYIIGNPFTAHMSMAEFMSANTDVKGYWTGDDLGPIAGNGEGTSLGDDDYLLPPYSGFFVYTDETDEPLTISFTRDMQTLGEETGLSPAPSRFAIRATNSVGTSSASLSYDDSATDDYDAREDVILLEDDSWTCDGLSLVYTVAGDMAVSVNRVNSMPQVPLGVFADEDASYTITFVGVDCLNEPSLFDSYTNTDTPLTEGYVLEMEGSSHGRYFIRAKGAATEISLTENEVYDITAYSPTQGTIIVCSSAELENVDVYSVGGTLLHCVNAGGNISCTINGINSGIAVVRACTSEGTFVKKLRVR